MSLSLLVVWQLFEVESQLLKLRRTHEMLSQRCHPCVRLMMHETLDTCIYGVHAVYELDNGPHHVWKTYSILFTHVVHLGDV